MTIRKLLFILSFALTACSRNQILTGDQLSKNDIDRIQRLDLLDKGEVIYKFYSNFKNSVAGNFFSNKRIAMYWIDDRDKTKDQVTFALYQDIKSIDTVFNAGLTYCPYMLITKKDNSTFKVCADGKRQAIKDFFEEAIKRWTSASFNDSTKFVKSVSKLGDLEADTARIPLGIHQYAFIVDIQERNDTSIIYADYIQYLSGQAAIDAAIKAHEADTFKTADGKVHIDVPNDNFIVNKSKTIRPLIVDKKCVINLIINQDRIPPVFDNSFSTLRKVFKGNPYILTLSKENVVIGIKEIFVP